VHHTYMHTHSGNWHNVHALALFALLPICTVVSCYSNRTVETLTQITCRDARQNAPAVLMPDAALQTVSEAANIKEQQAHTFLVSVHSSAWCSLLRTGSSTHTHQRSDPPCSRSYSTHRQQEPRQQSLQGC
jgi:hypothetical protein